MRVPMDWGSKRARIVTFTCDSFEHVVETRGCLTLAWSPSASERKREEKFTEELDVMIDSNELEL